VSSSFEAIKTAEIRWCDDTPYSRDFDDIYSSKDNGLVEAHHVFIQGNQIIERWQALAQDQTDAFVIAETGFGTGLNFLLTWSLWKKYSPPQTKLHYISCEKYPLKRQDLTQCLTLWPELQQEAQALLSSYPVLTPGFHFMQFEKDRVSLTLMLGDVLNCFEELLLCGEPALEKRLREVYVDAWFLDGFSPTKNPQMWSEALFSTMSLLSKPKTTVATYTAAGIVKQGLRAVGFNVDKKKGHGLKKDMVVGEFVQFTARHTKRHTPWSVSIPKKIKSKHALVLGAGLAGCFTAHALAHRGWSVTLLDANNSLAEGASGISQALLYPKVTRYRSPLNTFMLTAYLFAYRTYKNLLTQWPVGELLGILQLAYNEKEAYSQKHLTEWLACYPELGRLVTPEETSVLAGIDIMSPGLYIDKSGWLDCPLLCQYLATAAQVELISNTTIDVLRYEDAEWHVNEYSAEVLVIANGEQATMFQQTKHIPLKKIRGQMTWINNRGSSSAMKIPVCADIHILPARKGRHLLGATYHSDNSDLECYESDDQRNLSKLSTISTAVDWSKKVSGHWSGIRAATPDYLPLVGPVAKAEAFLQCYQGLMSNAKRWIPEATDYYPGLYLCAGFGSRGLTTIPLSAEWLAALINKEPSMLPRTMIESISPSRFLRRDIIRGQVK